MSDLRVPPILEAEIDGREMIIAACRQEIEVLKAENARYRYSLALIMDGAITYGPTWCRMEALVTLTSTPNDEAGFKPASRPSTPNYE